MVARPPDPRQHQLVKARGGGDIELAAKLDRRKPFRGLLASDAIIAEQGIFIFDEFTGNQHTAIGENRSQFTVVRSEEHTSELQSLMRISYAVFCLKKKTNNQE